MSADNNHREVKHTLCRMCADRCGVNLYLENGRIVDIDGFKDYPVNKGRMCVKGRAAQDLVYHPDRLLKPLKKTDHGWQEIPLEQALDEIAVKIKKVQQQYGERAVSVWKGEAVGFAQQEDIARRFIHAIGSPNYFSNDTACWVGKYIGYCLGYGQWQMGDYPQAKLIMLWGVNPPYSMATMMQDIMKGRENGAKMIVIDPRLSAVARQADIYVQLRPGTDGALALGLANLLISSNRYDRDFISRFTVGFDKFAAYVKKFTPEYVSAETSVPVAVIHEIADIMAAAAPQIAFHCGNGLEHHINGVNNVRAVSMLDALNGCLDTPGGTRLGEGPGLRGLTLYDEIPLRHLEPIGSTKYPVFYDFRQECHTMMSMDTMLTDKPYPLKAMLLTAANPVLSNPNTDKVKKALASLDLLVVRDLFMTETAELADYVLPAASFLEREELHSDSYQQILA
ncbi:MAG: molybdopterin-dependent oxidoreductase, partial [Clostridiales bacterium]